MEYGEKDGDEGKSELIFEGYYVFLSLFFLTCWILSMGEIEILKKERTEELKFQGEVFIFFKRIIKMKGNIER